MFTIGKASEQSGVNIETIRYYEREGVVPKPGARQAGVGYTRPMKLPNSGSCAGVAIWASRSRLFRPFYP